MGVAPEHLITELSAEAARLGWRPVATEVMSNEVRIVLMPFISEWVDEPLREKYPNGDVW